MNKHIDPVYTYPREQWDAAKCEKAAKRLAKDGLGTPYPWRGYIGSSTTPIQYGGYGRTTFNGGIVIDGEWYKSADRPLPAVAGGFTIVHIPTWGYRIIKQAPTQS